MCARRPKRRTIGTCQDHDFGKPHLCRICIIRTHKKIRPESVHKKVKQLFMLKFFMKNKSRGVCGREGGERGDGREGERE